MSIEELKELGIKLDQPLPDESEVWYEIDARRNGGVAIKLDFNEPK